VRTLLASLVCTVVVGCAAPANEEGGNALFDAAAPDDGSVCSETNVDAGTGTTWGDLYLDYFGPMGEASCAGNGQCHGTTTQPGFTASGYVCGPTAAACYSGITSSNAGLVTIGDTTDDPTTSGLYAVLRKCSGGGSMPKEPANFMFTSGDMARITAWIKAGAPND
jgi:hypothetical protein